MPKKRPLTLDEHRRLGVALNEAHANLQTLFVNTVQHSQRVGTQQKPWHKLLDQLDEVRSTMEDQFCREHPVEFDVHVYYPGETPTSVASLIPHEHD